MSQQFKTAGGRAVSPTLFAPPASDVHPKERERVEQLIASNQSGKAVDFAKDVHKRRGSPASEALLLEAYFARARSLCERNLHYEAKALMDFVHQRYPASRGVHIGLKELVEPLCDPALAPEKQQAIHTRLRGEVFDLREIAECPSLPADHALRIAAGALHRAFAAVTSGPVAEEALALTEVSRSSPLAPWKMLIRAIAAWYRRDDALCEKCLAAVEPGSAAARLEPAVRGLLGQPRNLTPAAASLVKRAAGPQLDSFRTALQRLDAALDRKHQPSILQEVRNVTELCRKADPALLDRLKQHIAIRCRLAGSDAARVATAMGGPSCKSAYFWRLLARSFEEQKEVPLATGLACNAWEEFRKHAISEGWLPARGPELATLYFHMADLLRHLPPPELERVQSTLRDDVDQNEYYYQGQPAEIRALMGERNHGLLYFLSPSGVLQRACEADPSANSFQRWMDAADGQSNEYRDAVAEQWSEALPNDIPPLLHLMQSAERRNALQKAFKLMERAEKIDGVNAEVRRARLRLLVSMAVRHLRAAKPRLAAKELLQIEALPQSQKGDRPAFISALRFVFCGVQGDKEEAARALAEAEQFLGDGVTAYLLFLQVERWCGRPGSALDQPQLPTVPLFAAFGRACAICQDFAVEVNTLTPDINKRIKKELAAPNIKADPRALAALGEVLLGERDLQLAYRVAAVGLAQGGESQARFLFLRARSLPPWEGDRRGDCLAAASELARRQHDAELLKRMGEWRMKSTDWLDAGPAAASMDHNAIDGIIQGEIRQRKYPNTPSNPLDSAECQCPACRAQRGEAPAGLPPGLPKELVAMLETLGPDAVVDFLAEMIGGGPKKRKRRRSPLNDSDVPF